MELAIFICCVLCVIILIHDSLGLSKYERREAEELENLNKNTRDLTQLVQTLLDEQTKHEILAKADPRGAYARRKPIIMDDAKAFELEKEEFRHRKPTI